RVTSDPSIHWNPVWSPDGRYLYYGSNRDGTLNLWRIPMDEASGKPAGEAEPLSLPAPVSGNFTLSQQGDLAYATVTRSYRILALPFDLKSGAVGAPKTLFGGSQEIMSFEPSPDGKSIAFTTGGVQEDLFVANADGSRVRQLTNDAAKDRSATWSPDSRTVYVYSNRDGTYHIWSIRTDGSNLSRITDDPDLKRHGGKNIFTPAASPDGRMLAVQTDRSDALVHLDRPPGQRLEPITEVFEMPRWSPDGTELVGSVVAHASAGLHRGQASQHGGIGVYSLASRSSRKVLDHGFAPQWLPGGRVAFFEKGSIGVLDLQTRLLHTALFPVIEGVSLDPPEISPSFASDGSVVYVRQTLEQGDVWLVKSAKN
ncbi:MAG: eukaryotic-like serine/threonine-protein kinase, partial [Acidobacteriota bacterium]|nr:eukaryotic-like serine/threonine-protein kinase [Acidobacteriota bacterium]